MYPGLFFTSSYIRQIYSAMIPSEKRIRPEKKEMMTTVEVQPGIFLPQKFGFPNNLI